MRSLVALLFVACACSAAAGSSPVHSIGAVTRAIEGRDWTAAEALVAAWLAELRSSATLSGGGGGGKGEGSGATGVATGAKGLFVDAAALDGVLTALASAGEAARRGGRGVEEAARRATAEAAEAAAAAAAAKAEAGVDGDSAGVGSSFSSSSSVCSPAFQWAQNLSHVFLEAKFAKRWGAPSATGATIDSGRTGVDATVLPHVLRMAASVGWVVYLYT